MLWFLGDVVSLTHQVVNELVGECFNFSLGNHIDHIRNAAFTFLDVELECLVGLFGLLIVFAGTTPSRLSFVVLGNSQMLIDVSLVDLENNLGIFVHFLM